MTGDRFRQIREELGFTLRELAERWGVHNSTVKREEQKQRVRGLYKDAIKRVQKLHGDDGDDEDGRGPTSSAPLPRSRR